MKKPYLLCSLGHDSTASSVPIFYREAHGPGSPHARICSAHCAAAAAAPRPPVAALWGPRHPWTKCRHATAWRACRSSPSSRPATSQRASGRSKFSSPPPPQNPRRCVGYWAWRRGGGRGQGCEYTHVSNVLYLAHEVGSSWWTELCSRAYRRHTYLDKCLGQSALLTFETLRSRHSDCTRLSRSSSPTCQLWHTICSRVSSSPIVEPFRHLGIYDRSFMCETIPSKFHFS